jgi:tRNA dimethylallyltransferase
MKTDNHTMSSTKYLIVLTGPTGIGKTDLSLRLNDKYNTSIISADSRQVYKEMAIGTAKPTKAQIESGNIKLVDFLSITEKYNAGLFEKDALQIIKEDHSQRDVSIICGGTGFYIKAVCEGLHEFPDVPAEVVTKLENELEASGIEELQSRLKVVDPITFKNIDIQNAHRLIRALSITDHTGRPFSEFKNKELELRSFKIINIVLDEDRDILYKRIENRVDKMIESGLIAEVESLIPYKNLKSLNTVGYSEVFQYLEGNVSRDFCIEEVKKNSRRYAKRQLTWLRKYNNGKRFPSSDFDGITEYIDSIMKS